MNFNLCILTKFRGYVFQYLFLTTVNRGDLYGGPNCTFTENTSDRRNKKQLNDFKKPKMEGRIKYWKYDSDKS